MRDDWTAAEWAHVNALLDEALDLEHDGRTHWLDGLSEQDRRFRATLERLLGYADGSGDGCDSITLPTLETESDSVSSHTAGDVIGPYRLIRSLGSGGMGSVWLAERVDGKISRQIALKLPRTDRPLRSLADRMAREREILATLEHPRIARLYDAGVTDHDQPYLALEFVEGRCIDDYCREKGADVRQVLALFHQVTEAVAYAHSKLVVHRDIKPANVLVTDDGQISLLDFGIAKLLEDDLGPSKTLTREGGLPLTPMYAAPEQLSGEPVTVGTDVYALGVLLYELLAEAHPHDRENVSSAALQYGISNREPTAPSVACKDARRARQLRGDLDTIVQRCLKKVPAERYQSVAELADDVDRYLRGYPIKARPDSLVYRVRKLVGRYPIPVAISVVSVVAVVIATAVTYGQLKEAQRQRDTAFFHQQRVAASNEMYSVLLADIGAPDTPLTPTSLLSHAEQMLDRQFDSTQPFLGHLYYDLSRRFAELGQYARQTQLLEKAERSAAAQGDEELRVSAACALTAAQILDSPERSEERFQRLRQALSRLPASALDARMACARLEARLLQREGEFNAAIAVLEQARNELENAPLFPAHPRSILVADLGLMYYNQSDVPRALSLINEALAISQRAGRARTLTHQVFLANKATIYGVAGEYRLQADAWTQIMAVAEEWHEVPINLLAGHATALGQAGEHEAALQVARIGHRRARASGNRVFEAMTQLTISKALTREGDYADADRSLDQAHTILSNGGATLAPQLAAVRLARAENLYAQDKLNDALRELEPLLAEWGYPESLHSPGTQFGLKLRAQIALDTGDLEAANHYVDDQLKAAIEKSIDPARSADVGRAYYLRANIRERNGARHLAAEDLRVAVVALENGLGNNHPETLRARAMLDPVPVRS